MAYAEKVGCEFTFSKTVADSIEGSGELEKHSWMEIKAEVVLLMVMSDLG